MGHSPAFTQQGVGTSPGYDAIDLRRASWFPAQEGVGLEAAWTVYQRAAGANMSVDIDAHVGPAWVQGDSVGFQARYMVAPHSVAINETIATAHASLPRIDSVILEVQDNIHDSSGGNLARTRMLTGTATGGATLDNRTGAAALPPNALLLADVLVGAAVSSITNTVIRDRRKWAFGAYRKITRNANASLSSGYSVGSSTIAQLDASNLQPRIECSGVPVRVTLRGSHTNSTTGAAFFFSPQVDGAGVDGMASVGVSAAGAAITDVITTGNDISPMSLTWVFTPSAGSHLIGVGVARSLGSEVINASSVAPIQWEIEEIVRADVNNNATTTG